jgi:peptide/nickel transport system ATP-binding protein
MNTAFSIRNLSVVFGKGVFFHRREHTALDNVSLDIPAGQAFGIVGSSGSGKSTLARVLSGLISPTRGSVTFAGIPVTPTRAFHQNVQMVFQDPASSLNPRLRIQEALSLPLRSLRGLRSRTELRSETSRLLEEVGISPSALGRFPHEFSGGQAQRIAIARALAAHPACLILDEATSALDVSIQAQILLLLREIHSRHKLTLIFISHDLDVIRETCTSAARLAEGRITAAGPVADVLGAGGT